MAGFVQGPSEKNAAYRGLESIFEFVNDDGKFVLYNCGQAAATTLLTHRGCVKVSQETACRAMGAIESAYPPDNLGGWFGTSRRRVTQICKAHGVRVEPIAGEAALRAQLDQCRPVIVMLGVSGGKLFGYDLPGGHWMVAYGYDEESVYLTNWGTMTWDEFRRGWNALVPRLIQMRERGLVARAESPLTA